MPLLSKCNDGVTLNNFKVAEGKGRPGGVIVHEIKKQNKGRAYSATPNQNGFNIMKKNNS